MKRVFLILVLLFVTGFFQTPTFASTAKRFISLSFSVFVDEKGGSNACQTGVLVGNQERYANSIFQVINTLHNYDINFYYSDKDTPFTVPIKTTSKERKKIKADLRKKVIAMVRNEHATFCAKFYPNSSIYEIGRDRGKVVPVEKLKRIRGYADSEDLGLRFHFKNMRIKIERLQACCRTDKTCSEVRSWPGNCSERNSVSLGPNTTCSSCSKVSSSHFKKNKAGKEKEKYCCIYGRCEDLTLEECGNREGIYFSGNTCSVKACRQKTGACLDLTHCLPWRTRAFCDGIGAKYLDDGSECPSLEKGACIIKEVCHPDKTKAYCTYFEGKFLKNSGCPAPPKKKPEPRGACCDGKKGCQVVPKSQCHEKNSFIEGVKACAPDHCRQTTKDCQIKCPFTGEHLCFSLTQKECTELEGFAGKGNRCRKSNSNSPKIQVCSASVCDGAIGLWNMPDGSLVSLNAHKRAARFDPVKNPKAGLGQFTCTPSSRTYPASAEITVKWSRGNTQTFYLPKDLSSKELPKLCHTKEGWCATRISSVDQQTHDILMGMIPKDRQLINRINYDWITVPTPLE